MIAAGSTLQQRYKIDKQIGQGGMGAVYIATDERFGSTVAIKETLCMDTNFRKAIEREARLLNSLKHPALPRVSDHFEEDNSQFLVMEYIPGEDVGSILEHEHRKFEVDQVIKWADQLLDALDYLHGQENPVVHRDIKPQNLKITPRGEIILLDFGLAKGNPTDAASHTAAKSIFGYSRNYASLEQIQGTGTDPRSDLYALAATLYHLVTNRAPEDALTRAMAVLSNKPDPLIPASDINPAVTKGIAGVLQCAMSLNADDRPSSAANLRDMFRQSANFAYLLENGRAGAGLTQGFSGQVTEAFGNATWAGAGSNEAKTEVLPAYTSQPTAVHAQSGHDAATRVASAATTTPPRKRSFFSIALAGTAALLLGCGAVAGGIYLFRPSAAGPDQQVTQPVDQPILSVSTASNANANANAQPGEVGASSSSSLAGSNSSPTAETHQVQQSQTEKQSESAKADKPTKSTKTSGDTSANDTEIPDIKIANGKGGEMVITQTDKNGQVTTTRVPMKPPFPGAGPGQGYDPFPRGFDPRVMTPEQKRKLQQMMRRNQQMRRPPDATPSPQYDR